MENSTENKNETALQKPEFPEGFNYGVTELLGVQGKHDLIIRFFFNCEPLFKVIPGLLHGKPSVTCGEPVSIEDN